MQEKETNNYLFALVGSNIKFLRSITKLSQEELASKMGISRQQLVNYETKEIAIPLKQLNKLKQIFDIRIDELVYTDLSQGGIIDLTKHQNTKKDNLRDNKESEIESDYIESYLNVADLTVCLVGICGILKEHGEKKFSKEEFDDLKAISSNLKIPFNAIKKQRKITPEEKFITIQSMSYAIEQLSKYIIELEAVFPISVEKIDDLISDED